MNHPTQDQIDKLPKWARNYVRELQHRVTTLEGLPDRIERIAPDLPPPSGRGPISELTRGWEVNTYHLRNSMGSLHSTVEKACSSCVHNGSGWKETRSQGSRTLYSTEKRAWMSAKAEFVHWAAEKVSQIDDVISKASDEPYKP